MKSTIARRCGALLAAAVLAAGGLAACSKGNSPSTDNNKRLRIAYLSFAVANSYDAPMLAAAKAAASARNADVEVFDAANSDATQFSQFQNAITSGRFDGIIVQPIVGTALVPLAQQAITQGIKVVNIDQILGPDYTTDQPQVDGLSGNVVFIPDKIGRQLGELAVAACASKSLNPCNIGFIHDIKASTLGIAIKSAFDKAIAGTPSVKIVAEGESFFNPGVALQAAQNMLQAQPGINLFVSSDQGLQGVTQALAAANKPGSILMVGYGGSAAGFGYLKDGTSFGDVVQAPASEGQLGMEALINAIRTGANAGAVNPVGALPNDGVANKDNVDQFTAEWPG
ncbi:MAG TPA: sugar ABC transporter substrate-binding protein [Micromonosporaceae bacterium]|jgi:ribose transport system substrate-binding protein